MEQITGQHEGDVVVGEGQHLRVTGQLVGTLRIEGGLVEVSGQAVGPIEQTGGRFVLAGQAVGYVSIEGGRAEILGTVVGIFEQSPDADVHVAPNALFVPER